MSTIDRLLEHNASYATGFAQGRLASAPAGRVAVVSCMDARLRIDAMLGLSEGDAHVIRNAGGIVTDDVIRSLTLSQRLLGTREVMLIQHTDCGLTDLEDAEVADTIERDTGVRPPFALGAFPDLEANLRLSIGRVTASPFLPHRDAVRGFVYEVGTGRLREVS